MKCSNKLEVSGVAGQIMGTNDAQEILAPVCFLEEYNSRQDNSISAFHPMSASTLEYFNYKAHPPAVR